MKTNPLEDTDDTHLCPVPGCTVRVPRRFLMCNPHWRRVPPDIQKRVFAGWKDVMKLNEYGSYKLARRDAIEIFTGPASTAQPNSPG